jgi:outer membrane receptor for Fe3+-dicitrate
MRTKRSSEWLPALGRVWKIVEESGGMILYAAVEKCWKSTEADEMGQWKAFWNLLGFTQKVKAKVDFFF